MRVRSRSCGPRRSLEPGYRSFAISRRWWVRARGCRRACPRPPRAARAPSAASRRARRPDRRRRRSRRPTPIWSPFGDATSVRMTMLRSAAPLTREQAERAGVDAARAGLERVDDLHRAQLRRAGHRAAGERGAHRVERGRRRRAAGRGPSRRAGAPSRRTRRRSAPAPRRCPARTRAPRSLRTRSTIMRFSARSFSSARSAAAR